jgi:hypothetical protein
MDVLKKLSHRYVSKLHSRPASHPQSEGESNHLQSSAYCQTASGIGVDYEDHNVYENRKSTAEEPEEDEDINLIKQKIRGLKLEDLSSTEYALYLARQAEEKGRSALMNLAEQADRIQEQVHAATVRCLLHINAPAVLNATWPCCQPKAV